MFEVSKQITPATVVPATAGYFQLRFHFRNDIKVNINNVMANVRTLPIVGWRIGAKGRAEPVTIEDEAANNTAVAILYGGKVIEPGVASWPNLDAWMQAVLRDWQAFRKPVAA
jgi:hypothetical protein